ncbi:MAG: SUF system NifU family Fe-S cluster assembly protein [Candidatus Hydrogenedentes bacterium]|nr:SUF system NifU family Fe-S cluster assembly protein [Candidatus Hydrogenedentota bacterium]
MNLYDHALLEHNRHPRHFRAMADATFTGEAHNPLCGDQIAVYLRIDDGKVADVSFQGKACAVAVASASLMTLAVRGQSLDELPALCRSVFAFLNGKTEAAPLDILTPLARVRDYPVRIGCGELPWRAIQSVLRAQT